jgi:gliding motility-associated-like protein
MRQIITIALILIGFTSFAQITNPGFESHNGMPSNVGQYYLADGWSNAGSSASDPDYYHYFGSQGGDIPQTPVASINSWEGNAIMGAALCGQPGNNYREYLSNELSAPLQVGMRYLVSFRMTNGDLAQLSAGGYGVSNIGVAFSDMSAAQVGNSPLMVTPTFELDTLFYSKDWRHVQFAFVAVDAARFMTIGVFGTDAGKEIEVMGGTPSYGYYFFDDFRMEVIDEDFDFTEAYHIENEKDEDTTYTTEVVFEEPEFFIPNAFSPNGDGENDIFLPVSPNYSGYKFEVFSRWGELLFQTTDKTIGWDGKHVGTGVKADVYVWQVTFMEHQGTEGTVEKQVHGTVNLIR